MSELVLGPVLRYVDATSATVWVQTSAPCTVEVLGCTATTFRVGGHHYALVAVRELPPDSTTEYEVRLDGTLVWPTDETPTPSRITTVSRNPDRSFRLLFGSCRFGDTGDPRTDAAMGPDALASYADHMIRQNGRNWPHALLLLGDQIYADQTTPPVQEELRRRRDLRRPPGTEVADFEEYTYLYRHAWSHPKVRWLLSTVPTMMIFDDHDVRDDWNTSRVWRDQMADTPWWRERLLGGLASYWLYQHIGNLSPDLLDRDETYQRVLAAGRDGDALPVLRELAAVADTEHDGQKGHRWSYHRDLGPTRVVVIDTRGGRILDTRERAMLSERDFDWVKDSLSGHHEHVVVVSSLPWLLPPAIHHLQSWNEQASHRNGLRGRLGEQVRQLGDLEHWAAFRESFDRLTDIIGDAARVADAETTDRSDAPRSVSVLSGDVHHSYVAEAHYPGGTDAKVSQVVCSPLRNVTPQAFAAALRAAWASPLADGFRAMSERAGTAPLALQWFKTAGPYFGNMVGLLEFDGPRAAARIQLAEPDSTRIRTLCYRDLTGPGHSAVITP